jgi:hypothetical protein
MPSPIDSVAAGPLLPYQLGCVGEVRAGRVLLGHSSRECLQAIEGCERWGNAFVGPFSQAKGVLVWHQDGQWAVVPLDDDVFASRCLIEDLADAPPKFHCRNGSHS